MFRGTLPAASRSAHYIGSHTILDEHRDPLDISSATEIEVIIRDKDTHEDELTATLSGASVSITGTGTFSWTFTDDQMSELDYKTYDFLCRATISGVVSQEIIGSLPVLDG